jgi:hypothetical protein
MYTFYLSSVGRVAVCILVMQRPGVNIKLLINVPISKKKVDMKITREKGLSVRIYNKQNKI